MGHGIVIVWLAAAVVASLIGWRVKGRPLTGFLLGVFLSWFGVLILVLLPPTAEMKVQRRVRDTAISEEADRRRSGEEPWSRDVTPSA